MISSSIKFFLQNSTPNVSDSVGELGEAIGEEITSTGWNFLSFLSDFGGALGTAILTALVYYGAKYLLDRQSRGQTDWNIVKTIILFIILTVGFVAFIVALPMNSDTKSSVTTLLAIVISAMITISSASFIGNALAGILMRIINNFRPGDFIRVNEIFGRISERGLFHTEVQAENRDLITLPNMFLANNPVRVTRTSGCYITAEVSLGYDVDRKKIEKSLIRAAEKADLTDPFVHVISLGDFSIVYRVHGLLKEVKTVLSARSRLHAQILDALHEDQIEIVSPTFMNQRQVNDTVFIPKKRRAHENREEIGKDKPESIIFDKADQAESLAKRQNTLAELEEKLKVLQADLKAAEGDEAKASVEDKIKKITGIRDKMLERINQQAGELEGGGKKIT